MQLTDAQRQAVEHSGGHAIVSASAGSGKTEVLARRCLRYLSDPLGRGTVDRLLVVTFTRAAAAELRVRVGRMLRETAAAEEDPGLRGHLLRQSARIDGADIGTIDAWCQRVLRTHFVEAAVDPGFAILGEDEASLLRRQILQQTMQWVYETKDEAGADARDWISAQSRPNDAFLSQAVLSLNLFRERLVDPEAWFAGQVKFWQRSEAEIVADTRTQLARQLQQECRLQGENLDEMLLRLSSSKLRPRLESYRDYLVSWEEALDHDSRFDDVLRQVAECGPSKPSRPDAIEARMFKEVRRWYEKRLEKPWDARRIQRVLGQPKTLGRRVRALLGVEAEYQRQLQETKLRRSVFEFGDVLRRTLTLLQEQTDVAEGLTERLRDRYDQIMIDEYQDTSPLQVALFRLLSRSEPGNRVMVGDLKQSIYGFRDADPTLFVAQQEAFDQGDEPGIVRTLQENFRSNAELVAAFNQVFAGLFSPDLGGIRFDDRQVLRACREEALNTTLGDRPRFRVSLLPEARRNTPLPVDEDGLTYDQIEVEGFAIAGQIEALRREKVCKSGRNAAGKIELQPLQYGDMVVLVRRAKTAVDLARVLRRQGIPVMIVGRESILDSAEVRDLVAILRLLGNQRLDLEMAAYLRGPAVGLNERDLLAIHRWAPRLEFARAVQRYARDDVEPERSRALREALEKLQVWRRASRVLELPQLLRQVLHESGLELFARGLPSGTHRTAVLDALLAMAERFVGREPRGVTDFVQYLDALAADDLDPEVNVASSSDVVRIMTIHMSKGLEFPVVFLADAGAMRQRSSPDLICDHESGLGLQTFDARLRTAVATPGHLLAQQRREATDASEELRLLYVAATRACEIFHVTGFAAPDLWEQLRERCEPGATLPLLTRMTARSVLEWTLIGIGCAPGREALFDVQLVEPASVVQPQMRGQTAALPSLTEDDRAWVSAADRLLGSDPRLAQAKRPGSVSVSALKAVGAAPARVAGSGTRLRRPRFDGAETSAQALGTLVHRYLELVSLGDLADIADIEARCSSLIAAERLRPEAADLLPVDDLAWFGQTDLCDQLAREGRTTWREQAFAYPLPAQDGLDPILLRGMLDCLVETPAGLHLLDYKTDRVPDGNTWHERSTLYERQLQLYALAVGAMVPRPLVSAHVVFLRARRLLSVDVSEPVLDAIRKQLAVGHPVGP